MSVCVAYDAISACFIHDKNDGYNFTHMYSAYIYSYNNWNPRSMLVLRCGGGVVEVVWWWCGRRGFYGGGLVGVVM